MFLGGIPGSIGETSALAILAGGAWLMLRKVITWRIPVSFIGSVAVLTLVFGCEGYGNVEWMLYNVLSGGLLLGAFFMATDYSTSPVNLKGPNPLRHRLRRGHRADSLLRLLSPRRQLASAS